jgi:hypothetical protein
MPIINLAGSPWSLGSLIAVIVLLLCVVLAVIGHALTPLLVLVLIALLAIARLT